MGHQIVIVWVVPVRDVGKTDPDASPVPRPGSRVPLPALIVKVTSNELDEDVVTAVGVYCNLAVIPAWPVELHTISKTVPTTVLGKIVKGLQYA